MNKFEYEELLNEIRKLPKHDLIVLKEELEFRLNYQEMYDNMKQMEKKFTNS